jgi:translocation and assembly module TamB
VALDVTDATVDGWDRATAHVEATLRGRRATGRAIASLGNIASINLETKNVEIGGAGPLEAGWWRRTWGEVDASGRVDLEKLNAKLPAASGAARSQKVSGVVDFKAEVERDGATDDTPRVTLQAGTKALVLSGEGKSGPWKIDGVDTLVSMEADGDTGHTTIDAQLLDATGLLANLDLSSDGVPYTRLFRTSDDPLDVVEATPFSATLTVPERDIATLPAWMGTRDLHGQMKGSLEWTGMLLQPSVTATASLSHARTDVTLFAMPVDFTFGAQYDGMRVHATVGAQERSKQLLDAQADVDARAIDLLETLRSGKELPWKASARAKLASFPLQSIGAMDNHQVRGLASGDLVLDGLHEDAMASASLKLDGLRVGDVVCKNAGAEVRFDGGGLRAQASIDEGDGMVSFTANAPGHWGSAMAPSLDASQQADVSLVAKRFRAEVLQPFLAGVFAQLDGRIDADAKLTVDPIARTVRPEGSIELQDGTFELASYGGEFHDVAGKILLSPDGIVRMEDFTMRGLSGRVLAAASARFEGLSLVGARAEVQLPKNEPLPLFLDGVQAGTADGHFSITNTVDPERKAIGINIDVPALHTTLPTETAHDVQPLGDLDSVRTGVRRSGAFQAVRLDGEVVQRPETSEWTTRTTIHLGDDVVITRGDILQVGLGGSMSIVTDKTGSKVTGQLRIPEGGKLDVQGKPFKIDKGTVSFLGDDPTNPQVAITAQWTAKDADSTTVYADFVGPLRTAKLTLRSEPAHGNNEILALILYGTMDLDSPSASSTQGYAAAGQAGGAATGPLNKALGGVNKVLDNFGFAGGIVTKLDTSSSTPRPEVELQIARDISVQVAWVLGVPPPGANPDSTLFTLYWRFKQKFQLEATVGDAGTTILDLVWQHRY